MNSATRGSSILKVEVTRIGDSGLWLTLDSEELELPFDEFPWFRGASASAVRNVERPFPDRLRWPELDVDLAVESIRHPERFPLVSAATRAR